MEDIGIQGLGLGIRALGISHRYPDNHLQIANQPPVFMIFLLNNSSIKNNMLYRVGNYNVYVVQSHDLT